MNEQILGGQLEVGRGLSPLLTICMRASSSPHLSD